MNRCPSETRNHDRMSPWILVIDDDPWTREALVAILRRAGYQVTTVARFGPELAGGGEPPGYQVAVVDFHLPTSTAWRWPGAQRAAAGVPHRHDFFGAARSGRPGRRRTVVDRFLAKPFSKDAILEVIAQLCPTPAA